jgi:hypothetical protein
MYEEKLQKILIKLVEEYIDKLNILEEDFKIGKISPSGFIEKWDAEIKKLKELRDKANADFIFTNAIIKAFNKAVEKTKRTAQEVKP